MEVKKDFGVTRNKVAPMNALMFGKVPPQDTEIESAVLGAILNERDAFPEIFPIISKPEVFYKHQHEVIYNAILEVVRRGDVIDMLTVIEQLTKTKQLEDAGGAHYIATISNNVVSSGHIKSHAAIIVEKYILREIIKTCSNGAGAGYDNEDPFELLDRLTRDLHEINNIVSLGNTIHISVAGKECVEQVDKILSGELPQGGITSGIKSIDAVTGGWQNTDLIIIAARPAIGKTAFVLNMVVNCMEPVLIFSLEMGKQQLYKRIVANTANIPLDFINKPERMYEDTRRKWHEEYAVISGMPIFINDKAGVSITEIVSETKKYKRKHHIGLVAIDYLQLIRTAAKKGGNREQEVAYITRELKIMAKDLNIPVIALSQLNRAGDTGKPTLANLRESGAIEQDADIVTFLYKGQQDGDIILDFAKHRNGVTRDVLLKFDGAYQRFKDDDPEPFPGRFQNLITHLRE